MKEIKAVLIAGISSSSSSSVTNIIICKTKSGSGNIFSLFSPSEARRREAAVTREQVWVMHRMRAGAPCSHGDNGTWTRGH